MSVPLVTRGYISSVTVVQDTNPPTPQNAQAQVDPRPPAPRNPGVVSS